MRRSPAEGVIYESTDPCVDIYYSAAHRALLVGARRVTRDGRLICDCLTHQIVAWPDDDTLGTLLLERLAASRQRITEPEPGLPVPSTDGEDAAFWYFVAWTKNDPSIPHILGTPYCSHYPESLGRVPVSKSATPSTLGRAFKDLVTRVSTALRLAGLPAWSQ